MAIIKTGVSVVGIRGTLDGVTYSQNKSGPYAKGWKRPVKKTTPAQTPYRSRFAEANRSWLTLSSTLQADWDTYAADPAQVQFNAFGDPYYLTGYDWFRIINMNRVVAGLAIITTVPTVAAPAAPTISLFKVAQTGANRCRLDWTGGPGTNHRAELFMAVSRSKGRITAPTSYRHILDDFINVGQTFISFATELEAAFGPVETSWRYFAKIRFQTQQGRQSSFSYDWVDGTAS